MPRRAEAADPLLRGELVLRQHGIAVRLVTGHGVFSAPAVDPGTAFLLRWLATDPVVVAARRVLDLGCGYGPLALWLAAADEARTVEAVDRDALAVECTQRGAAANALESRVRAYGSVGYDDVTGDVDLVVSNIPAKVGPAALRHLLVDGFGHVSTSGAVAVVVVDRLADEAAATIVRDDIEVLDHHRNRSYATWTYRFERTPEGSDPSPGFDRGVYRRASGEFGAGGLRWSATTSFTLPEFDTLAHGTVAAVDLIAAHALPGPVGLVGVGQGHTALALRSARPDVGVRLVDRDLLALRTAAANLGGEGVDLRHTARPGGALAGCRSCVAAVPEKEPVAVTTAVIGAALGDLPGGAPAVLHGRAADVSRLVEGLRCRSRRLVVHDRRGRPGFAAVLVTTPG